MNPKTYSRPSMTRRALLKGTGVCLALPWLEAFSANLPAAAEKNRLVCISSYLGFHTPFLFPEKTGRDYDLTPYLEPFAELKNDFSVISGLMHPGVLAGHPTERSFLSGAPDGTKSTVSVDQVAAESLAGQTRFSSLALGNSRAGGISFTRTGVPIPKETKPSALFAKLFLKGSEKEQAEQVRRLREGRSIMDALAAPTKSMAGKLGARDKDRLDEYFTSIREVEGRLADAEEWSKKPKPEIDAAPPKDITNPADIIGSVRSMYDLMLLAFKTDSTRVISLNVFGGTAVPAVEGVSQGHHELSHHGKNPDKIAQLRIVEMAQMVALRDFLKRLKETKEEGVSLLDQTTVLSGSNLGNASNHDCRNLPIFLAGGGFKHGQHLATDGHKPLCNLYVQILRNFGIDTSEFGTSTGESLPSLES